MTGIVNTSVGLFIFLALLLSVTHIASASEVTGTLSSDGSSGSQQEVMVLGETQSNETVAQNSGQLQGSVVQGREESAALEAAANLSSAETAMWLIPLAGVALATLAFLLWRRAGI